MTVKNFELVLLHYILDIQDIRSRDLMSSWLNNFKIIKNINSRNCFVNIF